VPYESKVISKRGSIEEKKEIRKNASQNSYEPGGPIIDFDRMEEGHNMDDEEYEKYRK